MAGRNVVIRHNEVQSVKSGSIRVDRLKSVQTGTRFKLTIDGHEPIISDEIEKLVIALDNDKLARGIVGVFSMKEAPTIASIRLFLPKFNVYFPIPTKQRRSRTRLRVSG